MFGLGEEKIRVRGLVSDNLGCVSTVISFVRFVVVVNHKVHNSIRTIYHTFTLALMIMDSL